MRAQGVMMMLFASFAALRRSAAVFHVGSTQAPAAYFQLLDESTSSNDTHILVASVAVVILEAKSARGP